MFKSFKNDTNENDRFSVPDEEVGREEDPHVSGLHKKRSASYHSEEQIVYTIRCFPENEDRRRSSIPTKESTLHVYRGRRHSEVILNPSDVFNRDYFSKNSIFGRNRYLDGKLHRKSDSMSGEFRPITSLTINIAEGNESSEKEVTEHYVNPLEVSANGNEVILHTSDDFFEADDEIGRPNTHSTPKNSSERDTLFMCSESKSSSRRGSETRIPENSRNGFSKTNPDRAKSPLPTTTESAAFIKGARRSISRLMSVTPKSSKIKRRRSVGTASNDDVIHSYSNHLHDARYEKQASYEETEKPAFAYHPQSHLAKWHSGNVNGTGNQERRFSRVSVHPVMSGAARDAFGPRLSTVVDEVISQLSQSKHSDKDFHSKHSDLQYSSGGLLCSPSKDGALPPSSKGPPDNETLLFADGKRRIDMVLVYEEEDFGVVTEVEMQKKERRKVFRENLEKEGLEFELEDKKVSFDEKTYFLKIHAPWEVVTRYAELMNIKMPIKEFKPLLQTNSVFNANEMSNNYFAENIDQNGDSLSGEEKPKTDAPDDSKLNRMLNRIFDYDHSKIEEEPSFYKATFSRDREEQFVVKDRETFFTSAQRSQIVWQILMRAKYDSTEKVGIRRLLNDETYMGAFPLHEGSYEKDASNGFQFDRRLLYLEWARPSKWYKRQPLGLVRKYFGDKIGLYFAWLGFYTYMLILPSVIGVLCFLYGVCSLNSMDNIPSKEICDDYDVSNITLCPMCDKACRYIKLGDSCLYAKITYLFDNPATVFFAIFMSFWATTYLELWKRQQSIIIWEWDLQFIEEDEDPRPEFETSVKTFRINPVTREKEPYMPTWSRALRFFATGITVLCMIVVVLGAVLGTIIYRISLVAVIYSGGGEYLKDHAKIFTSMTAALINLIIIMILTKFYHQVAIWLTNIENPRTQTEYEDSYTFKIFLFEFVNFYSSLIYIAFFKGRFFMYPGDTDARSSEFLRLKGDVCDPAGCLSELCIQLAIIMIGKQCFNNLLELLYPKFWNWWYHRIHHNNTKKDFKRKLTRWEEDYQMQDAGRLALFEEYLEMVLQYGFVTLFVAAFPLAPLFALLNNIGEIRLDAYKMVTQSRRPLAERVEDIGAWFGILKGLTYAAVVSNAFVIAYTSDFIPRMVYKFVYSPTNDLRGYIRSSLSEFNTSDYTEEMGSPDDDPDPPICYYRGYRNGPDHPSEPYDLSPQYWHVFAARLAFVVVFEHIVFALTGVMAYVIPDVPAAVKTQMQRERLLAKEAKYEQGLKSKNNDQELLSALRDDDHAKVEEVLRRGSWGRRYSRNSGYDTNDVSIKSRKMSNDPVWEST